MIGTSRRQSGIDTLPRHTAGSSKLVNTIANNKINANNNDDSDIDSFILLKQRMKKYENDQTSTSSLYSEDENSPEKFGYTTKLNQNRVGKNPLVADNKRVEILVPKNQNIFKTLNQQKNIDPRFNTPTTFTQNSSDYSTQGDYSKLNKKRDKIYSNLLSLNKIENEQKSKILEQERQLEIQNMKLKDALIIHKSLTNFNQISDYEKHEDIEISEIESEHFIDRVPKRSFRKRLPIKFPSIVTKYEPQNYYPSPSTSPPQAPPRHYSSNLGYYRPRKSSSDNKIDLYLEKTEDIVDSTGRILSSNQTFKYLGETDPKTTTSLIDLKPQIYYKNPEIEINNHKYEIVSSTQQKVAATDLKTDELEQIIKIIEETEKQQKSNSTYYVNGHLIKPSSQQIPVISEDTNKPSFTIPQKIYKTYLDKKEASKILSSNSLRTSKSSLKTPSEFSFKRVDSSEINARFQNFTLGESKKNLNNEV